ncbi:MAG: autotransporter assembly complex family protein [Pseudomonadota bacterium]|nr:autotransporter assembly complex family protein [Pseudomonadota bacterium]
MAIALALGMSPVWALDLTVEVEGVSGDLEKNVRALLAVLQEDPATMSESRLQRLHLQARPEIEQALRPFGYYTPHIDSALTPRGGGWLARYRIDPGAPVRVATVDLQLLGEGNNDTGLQDAAKAFSLRPGDVADHRRYEESKTLLRRRALSAGYLDAAFDPAELTIDPGAGTAVITLTLNTGRRYRFGPVSLQQEILKPKFLARFVPFSPGDVYSTRRLLDLQYALDDTEYFSRVEVIPHPEQAVDGAVPIEVALDPNKRHKYTFGIGYGTDTGPRGTLGWDNRRVNSLGHRWRSQLKLAQVDASAQFSYLIPIDNPATDSLDLNGGLRETNVEDRTSRIARIGVARTDRDAPWMRILRLNLEHERFQLDGSDAEETILSLLPGANWTYTRADDPLYPRNGLRWSVDFLAGVSPDATPYGQALMETRWVHPAGSRGRWILRQQSGATVADALSDVPLSKRFFAGGDNSVRGYDYQELGSRNEAGLVQGGRYLVTASAEFEQLLWRQWGAAVFVDAGNAFDDTEMDLKTAAGLGLRWRSPVGPLKLDIAQPLDEPDAGWRLHLSLGSEL